MNRFHFPNTNLTFDLHYDNENKATQYRLWIQRVYFVASMLNLSYFELWELPEQEFLVLEELAHEVKRKKDEARNEVLAQQGGGLNGR